MALKYLYVPSGYKAETSSGTAYGVLPNVAACRPCISLEVQQATRVNSDGLVESMASKCSKIRLHRRVLSYFINRTRKHKPCFRYSEDFTGWNVAGKLLLLQKMLH